MPRTRALLSTTVTPKPIHDPETGAWLDADSSASRLKVSKRTIWNLVAREQLTAYRLGGTRVIRFSAAEIDALLKPSR